MPAFELLRRFGITVYTLPGLPEQILYLRAYRLALVDSSLDDAAREHASDLLLALALSPSRL